LSMVLDLKKGLTYSIILFNQKGSFL
jgi:hypothetical protein